MKFGSVARRIGAPVTVQHTHCIGLHAAIGVCIALLGLPSPAIASIQGSGNFLRPFATATRTYDSNLLNKPANASGPRSDQIDRFEAGTHLDFQISRQKFSGTLSVNQTRHDEFAERNTEGELYKFRWDAEIGKTITGNVEASSLTDQAPIQTGAVTVIERQQKLEQVGVNWNFHPTYAVRTRFANTETRFKGTPGTPDSVLSGLNRNDELQSIGMVYTAGTGSTLGLFMNILTGDFPLRQVIGPGQSVSNNFEQNEVELQGQWNHSPITRIQFSVAAVEREHDELPVRDYSGINYRVDAQYQPTAKSTWVLGFGRQIVGVSDASNSDALVRQVTVGYNLALSNKVLMRLFHRPQKLRFSGTDGLNAVPREETLKESSLTLEYQATRFLSFGTTASHRRRDSSAANSDYSANAVNVFVKFTH
ncbi:MAG TPA: outer membrane beta-barrel protein [Limnobacter sp.]|nr:outer membrane beta-barrel protein [Limnobacter sp.]